MIMDEESERMMALKKVYAEIIMNTSKEAAERIIVSERKALEYRHDLESTKNEALRLLIRLKQSMDSKVNEVEMRSYEQQRKIDELEAQLHEAEDIVGNLRAELNAALSKLDELSNKQIHASSNVMVKVVDDNGCSQSVIKESVASEAERINNGAHAHSSAVKTAEECGCSGEPEVPSIIIRRKETEQYRNGCTQRIRACDGNLLNGHKNMKEAGHEKECERISVNTPTMCVKEESASVKEVEDEETVDLMRYIKLLRTRRTRASRHDRNSISPVDCASNEVKKRGLGLDMSISRANLSGFDDLNVNVEVGTRSAPSNYSDKGALSENAFSFHSKLRGVCADDLNEHLDVASCSVTTTQQSTSRNNLGTVDSTMEIDTKNSSSSNLDAKLLDTCHGLSGQQKDRILKYTFQRKRKKDSIVDVDSD